MKNRESNEEKNGLEFLQEIIKTAPERTENEFATSGNIWLDCVISSIFVMKMALEAESEKIKNLISPEKYQEALDKLEKLNQRVVELKEQYPSKETAPPDEIKRELFEKLNILK